MTNSNHVSHCGHSGRLKGVCAILVLSLALAGCAAGERAAPTGINDPYEVANRRTHAFNKAADSYVVRPVSRAYVAVVPAPVLDRVGDLAGNFSTPGYVVNDLLQANFEDAGVNLTRFLANTILGFGGLFDVASEAGVPPRDSDFGETLHVWGLPEGAYVEMPIIGPSTERDRFGRIVDLFTNPLSYVLPDPESYATTGTKVLDKLGDRGRYATSIDSVLYDSADSYAQARTIYLQNRRFELGGAGASADAADPYDDPYGAGNADTDPYQE